MKDGLITEKQKRGCNLYIFSKQMKKESNKNKK